MKLLTVITLFFSSILFANTGTGKLYIQGSALGSVSNVNVPSDYFSESSCPEFTHQDTRLLSGLLGLEYLVESASGMFFIGAAVEGGRMSFANQGLVESPSNEVVNVNTGQYNLATAENVLNYEQSSINTGALFLFGSRLLSDNTLELVAKVGISAHVAPSSRFTITQRIANGSYVFEDYQVGNPRYSDARSRTISDSYQSSSINIEKFILYTDLRLELRSNLGFPDLVDNGIDLRIGGAGKFAMHETIEEFSYTPQIYELYFGLAIEL